MAERVTAGAISNANGVREAVCIHTKKIFSSCRDKDCIEDLRFYPTQSAQAVLPPRMPCAFASTACADCVG